MKYLINAENGLINIGNWSRIKGCMKKAEQGESIKIGFLGGSITQGCLSSLPELCYAYLVYEWWKNKFPKAQITYINAGIGATSSQYGVARVDEHLMNMRPDFVLIEYAVNEGNTDFDLETYEGLIRKTCSHNCRPAVMLMNNMRYDNGESAEETHLKVAKHYDLPMVSMKSTIWPEVEAGRIPTRAITPDDLHPNDVGHRLIADVIITFLEAVYEQLGAAEQKTAYSMEQLPEPITVNAYEKSIRYQNHNSHPMISGFIADTQTQTDIRDLFRRGWTASHKGDRICFSIECTGVAVQYRKSTSKPTPIARVVVDGAEETAVILDGNFQENWGDCLYIDTVTKHMELGRHTVEISIIETHTNDVTPFYLVSVIGSQ